MEPSPHDDECSVLSRLRNLAQKLQDGVSHEQSPPTLSHYRQLPDPVVQAYDLLSNGAALIHATATKFTLMGKIDFAKTQSIQEQLLQGCELVATGCIAICSDGSSEALLPGSVPNLELNGLLVQLNGADFLRAIQIIISL